jgi:hypothetical protein
MPSLDMLVGIDKDDPDKAVETLSDCCGRRRRTVSLLAKPPKIRLSVAPSQRQAVSTSPEPRRSIKK